jgi:hypothetical protein
MIRPAASAIAAVLMLALPRPAPAQGPAELWSLAEAAYQDLDYDSAAALLRRGLADPGAASLPLSSRLRALAFLGASELFRGSRDSALAAFRGALIISPRYRPDQLIFPPEVSTVYEETRLATKAVVVSASPRTELSDASDRLNLRFLATSYHDLVVTITREGAQARFLYSGAISDSLELRWDGRDDRGAIVPAGVYNVSAVSRIAGIGAVGSISLPLIVRHLPNDTLLWPAPPPDSLMRPERTPGALNGRSLAVGVAGALASVALPGIVGAGEVSGGRFAVAVSLTGAGIIGMLAARSGRPIAENMAANRALRAGWERQRDDVRTRNAQRAAMPRVVIEPGNMVSERR